MSRHSEDDRAAFRPPADWQPPYPAHSSRFGENVDDPVIAYLGCQAGDADGLQEHVSRLSGFLTGGPAPDYCDRAHFVDDDGYANEVFIGYWLKGSDHQRWLQSSGFPEWLVAPGMIPNDVGLWFEPINVTLSRLETIAGKPDYGLARAADNQGTETPDHAYFGSMRVRIASATEEADDLPSRTPPIDRVAKTRGRIVRIQPPANLAIIRSGQDWSRCEGDELATYLGEVEPKLADGMKFLREFPEEVGCLSCRYMIERRADGGDDAISFGHAVFASLGCLEAWAREHPTHLAIFDSFHRMIRKHKDARGLRLWHEVCVLDHQNPDFIYVNCTERTGLLRWFPEAGT